MTAFLVIGSIVIATTTWVWFDDKEHDDTTGRVGWVVGCLLLWIVVFPVYLVRRRTR